MIQVSMTARVTSTKSNLRRRSGCNAYQATNSRPPGRYHSHGGLWRSMAGAPLPTVGSLRGPVPGVEEVCLFLHQDPRDGLEEEERREDGLEVPP